MDILSDEQLAALIENGKTIQDNGGDDSKIIPVVMLNLSGNAPSKWLLASVDPNNHDIAYGLMQIGNGCPELGFVSLTELKTLKGYKDRGVYQDPLFESSPYASLAVYANTARELGQIALHM